MNDGNSPIVKTNRPGLVIVEGEIVSPAVWRNIEKYLSIVKNLKIVAIKKARKRAIGCLYLRKYHARGERMKKHG